MIAKSNYHTKLEDLAAGRELEILEQVAGIPHEYLNKKGHPCPICGGEDRFSLIDEARGTVFCRHCFNHGNRGYVNAVIHYGQASDYKEARKMILEHLTGNQSQPIQPTQKPVQKKKPQIDKTWYYLDETGKEVKKINRWEPGFSGAPKSMTPEVFHNGKWVTKENFKSKESEWEKIWNHVAGLPLNLPNIMQRKDAAVCIVEGEKCFDQLHDWGFLATTGSGGTNTKTDWSKYLKDRLVIILPDNDETGYKYALKTAQSLQDKATNIRIVFLPDLPEKGDIVDWVNAGGTREQFFNIVANTPLWDGKPFAYKSDTEKTENTLQKKNLGIIEESYGDVKLEKIDWLLSGIIPLSMVSCLVGDPENGKSTIYQWLAAKVSSQEITHFRGAKIPHGSVIFCNAEEVPGITTKPRLIENGADVTKIHRIKGVNIEQKVGGEMQVVKIGMTIEKGGLYLRQMLERHPDCKLVIFDPIAAYYGRIDNYKESDVRAAMESLNEIAQEFKIAIILVMHYSKSLTTKSIDKAGSSKAVIANARTAWSTTKDSETGIITFAKVKNNISPDYMGFTFEIVPGYVWGEDAGHVHILDEYCEKKADDFLREQFEARLGRGRPPKKSEAAQEWLIEFLKDGPKPVGNDKDPQPGSIRYEAVEAGFSWRTFEKAINSIVDKNYDKKTASFWSLKPEIFTYPKIALTQNSNRILGKCLSPDIEKDYNIISATYPKFTESREESEKSPESDDMVITSTVAEVKKRVNQIVEARIAEAIPKEEQLETIKKERLERLNRQTEENLKKVNKLLENVVIRPELQTEEQKAFRRAVGEK